MSAGSREASAIGSGRHETRPVPAHHGTALGRGTPMRILVAADEYPWPARSGYRQRLHWVLRTLSDSGAVDLLITQPQPTAGLKEPPPDVRIADLTARRPRRPESRGPRPPAAADRLTRPEMAVRSRAAEAGRPRLERRTGCGSGV